MLKISLETFSKVKEFVSIASSLEDEVRVKSEDEKYIVDGKSILGVFSLDLTKPLYLETSTQSSGLFKKFFL